MTETVDVRVMSYNVHMQKDDQAALAAVVRAAEPDVMLIQEAPRRLRWRARCAELARSLGMVVAVGGAYSLGNLVLTNLRVRAHETWCMQLPLTPGLHMRGAAFAVCSIGRTRFAVAGTHLSIEAWERPGQAVLVKKALDEIDLPLVFGGDINEDATGPAWQTLAAGLVDVGAATGNADRLTFAVTNEYIRIDGLFVDPRIAIRRYEVIDTPQTRRASDHYPIVADLSLPVA